MCNTKNVLFLTLFTLFLFGCFSKGTAKEQTIELIQTNGNCELPCFWGITPGETNWNETRVWLSELTKIYDEDSFYTYGDGGYPAYSLTFTLNDSKPYRQFTLIPTVGEEKIQRIVVLINNTYSDSDFISDYWQRYSVREFFKDVGAPDKIFINVCPKYSHSCFELLLVYEGEKTVISLLGGNLPDNKICPQIGEGGDITSISLSFANPLSSLDVLPPGWTPYTETEYWTPINDILGIDEHEFYERVISESPACFEVVSKE